MSLAASERVMTVAYGLTSRSQRAGGAMNVYPFGLTTQRPSDPLMPDAPGGSPVPSVGKQPEDHVIDELAVGPRGTAQLPFLGEPGSGSSADHRCVVGKRFELQPVQS